MAESVNEEAPVELDEEGQIETGELIVSPMDDGELDLEDDDAPPPPPPPTEKPTTNNGSSKKKKIAIVALVGVAVCAAIGLGLGFGLSGNKSSNNDNNNGATASSNGDVSTAAEDLDEEATTSTEATPAAAASLEDDEETSSTTTSTTTTNSVEEEEVMTEIASTATVVAATTAAAAEAASATDAAEPVPAPVDNTPVQTYDAVIIGAGWAGISATNTLLNAGVQNVIVLEAADYIGGRAKSVNKDGTTNNPNTPNTNIPYDIGAEWLYNTGGDITGALYDDGLLDGLLENDKKTVMQLEGIQQFYQQKRDTNTGEVTTEVLEDADDWMEDIWGAFLQFRENRWDELDGLSYADAIDSFIDQENWNDDEALQYLNLIEDAMEVEYTGDSSQMDTTSMGFFPPGYSSNTHYASVPGMGLGNLAAEYAQQYVSKINLNAKVTEINSEEDVDHTIVTYVENGVAKVAKAKTVLVTASLGVLKAGTINFAPSLPAYKQEVIDEMGFGLCNKVTLSWDNDEDIVWPKDKYWFLLITPDDETSGQWTTFFNPTELKGVPTLTAWVAGNEAIEAEKHTDEKIMSDVMKNLRSMFPSIRDPDGYHMSRWLQDENVRGAYVYPKAGRDYYDDADDLKRNVGRVWFAGEAMAGNWGSTKGAWETGEEAALDMAQRLLEVE